MGTLEQTPRQTIPGTNYKVCEHGRDHTIHWLGAMRGQARERYGRRLAAFEEHIDSEYPPARREVVRTAYTLALMAERDADIARATWERAHKRSRASRKVDAHAAYKEAADRHQRALELLLRVEELPERRRGSSEADALGRIRAGLADDLL